MFECAETLLIQLINVLPQFICFILVFNLISNLLFDK